MIASCATEEADWPLLLLLLKLPAVNHVSVCPVPCACANPWTERRRPLSRKMMVVAAGRDPQTHEATQACCFASPRSGRLPFWLFLLALGVFVCSAISSFAQEVFFRFVSACRARSRMKKLRWRWNRPNKNNALLLAFSLLVGATMSREQWMPPSPKGRSRTVILDEFDMRAGGKKLIKFELSIISLFWIQYTLSW